LWESKLWCDSEAVHVCQVGAAVCFALPAVPRGTGWLADAIREPDQPHDLQRHASLHQATVRPAWMAELEHRRDHLGSLRLGVL